MHATTLARSSKATYPAPTSAHMQQPPTRSRTSKLRGGPMKSRSCASTSAGSTCVWAAASGACAAAAPLAGSCGLVPATLLNGVEERVALELGGVGGAGGV